MNIYLLLYLLFIVAPIGTILHELGHVVGAKIVKADFIRLTIGLGKRIGTISLRNFSITIQSIFFVGGRVQSRRKEPYTRLEIVCITIFGPVSNGVFAILFYLLYITYPNEYVQILFLFNTWLAVVNIIPFKLRERKSDGYTIFKIMSKKSTMFK